MRQTAKIISTYTADVSGICSALYELGGMTVIHDPSGCNSTYNTHDEPRWYDMDSMVFISALTEIEAVMGDDEKLINDIVTTAKELKPKFIAVAGSTIPMMIGTDFAAVATVVESRTGIPTFGFTTNGMHSYVSGVSKALEAFARKMVKDTEKRSFGGVNVLGVTPLDFSVNGSDKSITKLLTKNGFNVISSWAMGSTLDDISIAGQADVNLVVTYSGLAAAKILYERFATPYVIGTPVCGFADKVINALKLSQRDGECRNVCESYKQGNDVAIIGEGIYSQSLACALSDRYACKIICPLECENMIKAVDEDEIIPHLDTKYLVADPMYKPICPSGTTFVPLAHEGFSGRIYRDDIPNLIDEIIKI